MDANIATPLAAFAAGLATSLHCAGMCGPLACAVGAEPLRYHGSRFIAYSAVGGLCGALGQVLVTVLKSSPMRLAPWAMAVALVLLAFGAEKRLPRPEWANRLLFRARLRQNLGFFTLLIPCGPLWLMFGVAAMTGSAWRGALLLACFVAGTIPLYALFQTSLRSVQRRFSPLWIVRSQRLLALTAAGLLVWRAALPIGACCH